METCLLWSGTTFLTDSYISPCVSVCRIDKQSRICTGCKRAIDQITNWTKYTQEERIAIMKELGYGKRRGRKSAMP